MKLSMKNSHKNKLVSTLSALSILFLPIIGCTAASYPNGPASTSIQESMPSEGPAAQTQTTAPQTVSPDFSKGASPDSSAIPHSTIPLSDSQVKSSSSVSDRPSPVSLIHADGVTLQDRILPPSGFTRLEQPTGSLGEFLRTYPLLPDQSPVLLFDGREKGIQTDHVAVFDMHLSDRDLQQCADSVMRVYAEYFWNSGQYDRIAFHFVNGFLCSYDTWRQGNRVKIQGNQVQWTPSASADTSWDSLESYLNVVFGYASTLSMYEESEPADLSAMQIGDVFLRSGSPGHVVMVVDMCTNENGETAFLLAQGYMPAQQFHILKNPAAEGDEENPWYYTSNLTWPFHTPEYTFEEGSFRRLTY